MDFDFRELSEFENDLLDAAQEFEKGKHAKAFLRKEGSKLNRENKKQAKSAGIGKKTGNFIKGFKRGKIYKFNGSLCIRGYSKAPHAHLLNNGHRIVGRDGQEKGFKPGKRFLEKSKKNFEGEFEKDIQDFIDELLDKHGMGY
ncbi:hypothetical protein EUAN_06940 [Andreesenia angusta]|uniref:HK97 gp10 family phage protein n=1 Tax=Andreesenia angusta TaxID=39480 RepID=A0A1S1V933_9FIRM|nr:HK97 gp10 family phage protein [Andreesenia angusta]OHW62910.1 hypothetical protein EUAN_06940 [Andreesenia angusta]